MKVLITGTFCSGKSTLVSDLDNRLPNFTKVLEPARELITTLPDIKWEREYIRMYLTVRQVVEERLALIKFNNILVDAGTISNIIHENVLTKTNNSERIVDELVSSTYDLIFLCDFREIEFHDDGKRIKDLELRENLHKSIVKYLNDKDLKYHLVSGTREQRLLSAEKLIQQC